MSAGPEKKKNESYIFQARFISVSSYVLMNHGSEQSQSSTVANNSLQSISRRYTHYNHFLLASMICNHSFSSHNSISILNWIGEAKYGS